MGCNLLHVYIHVPIYYTLGNLTPHHQSTLKSIQLVTVVKSTHVLKYGIDVILQPSMEGIKALECVSNVCLSKCIRGIISCRTKESHLIFEEHLTSFRVHSHSSQLITSLPYWRLSVLKV